MEENDRRVEEMVQQGTSVIRIVQLRRTIGRHVAGMEKIRNSSTVPLLKRG